MRRLALRPRVLRVSAPAECRMSRITDPALEVNDLTRAIAVLEALHGDLSDVQSVRMDWAPASKARPRFGRGGRAYTPAESRAAEARAASFLRAHVPEPMTGNVALACIFYRENKQRIDADNMLKLICDAANGILWLDDSQVTAVVGVVELDAEKPRTVIAWSPHESSMTRGTDATAQCERCGKPYNIAGKISTRRFCSTACAYASQRTVLAEIPCRECGQSFRPVTKTNRLCSPACRVESMRGRNRARAMPFSECAECGKQLTHHRGGRCRDCWRAAPNKYGESE